MDQHPQKRNEFKQFEWRFEGGSGAGPVARFFGPLIALIVLAVLLFAFIGLGAILIGGAALLIGAAYLRSVFGKRIKGEQGGMHRVHPLDISPKEDDRVIDLNPEDYKDVP